MDARSHRIVEELKELHSPLAQLPVAMPFRVPDGYFEVLSAYLETRLSLEENSAVADPGPAFGRQSLPFEAPEGYFDQLPAAVAAAIAAGRLEAHLSRANVFAVPEGYFDTLSANILAAVAAADETEETLPADFSRAMPFEVPEGYFAGFGETLRVRMAAEEAPKVIPLRPRRQLPIQLMRWAAAAALIIGVSTGIRQAGTPQSASKTMHRALAAVPEHALQEYISQNMDDFDAELIEAQLPQSSFEKASPVQNLDTREIQSFLSEEGLL